MFVSLVDSFLKVQWKEEDLDRGFLFTNDTMVNLFSKLENNGLAVDSEKFLDFFGDEQTVHIRNNIVYTQYNFLTSTGRPSNRFGGVNYAALKKEGGERTSFVSRFGKDGNLVMMDYSAFHPRLIAHLSNFDMEKSVNPYEYLAQHYFNKTNIDAEDIAVSKGFTFTQIYGGIDKRWLHIPYFHKTQEYINHRWKFFVENGYIETPKYGRKIKLCHIGDPSPNKLFNYILQAYETEMAVETLGELMGFLKDVTTAIPVLYTYDSVLFDVHKQHGEDIIKKVKSIMEKNDLPVKVYVGDNYDAMKHVVMD
jgi:DNA polymerase I-like protein with 3'-5' exonuclease and polymerase domains